MHAAQMLCDAVKENDLVYIITGFVLLPHKVPEMDGTVNRYTVSAVGTVSPEDVDAVQNSGYPLVLYTCTVSKEARVTVYCSRAES